MPDLPLWLTQYLDTCGPAAQERLLTTELIQGTMATRILREHQQPVYAGCLVGVARGYVEALAEAMGWGDMKSPTIEDQRGMMADTNATIHHFFDRAWLHHPNRPAFQQQIRNYIVEFRLRQGGTIPEPSYAGELSDATT